MSITRPKPKTTATTADTFIQGAPDAGEKSPKPRHVIKGKKVQVTLTIAPTLLEGVDKLAAKLGQSRAGVINMAIYRMIEHGVIIDGLRADA